MSVIRLIVALIAAQIVLGMMISLAVAAIGLLGERRRYVLRQAHIEHLIAEAEARATFGARR